jgi:PAS domain S-box-containing protein
MNKENNSGLFFPARASFGRDALWIVSVALIYFTAARLSLLLLFQPEGIAAIWPPAGIFLSAILLTRRNLRPWLVGTLFITDFIAECLAGTPFLVSAIYALALTGDAALSCWLLLRFVGEPITFRRVRDVFGFLMLAVILSNALMSLVAAAASELLSGTHSFWDSWRWWAASDGVGNVLVTPFILSWAAWVRTRSRGWNRQRAFEGAALFIPLALLNFALFRHLSEHNMFALFLLYATFPFLLWAALRFEMRGVTTALVIMAAIAIPFIASGRVPSFSFAPGVLNDVIFVQLFLAITAVPALFLAAVVAERKQALETLRESEALLNKSETIAHNGSWKMDLIANRLTWSDEVYRMFGLRPVEFGATYEAFLDTIHPDDRATVDATYSESLREGRDMYEIEHRIVRRDNGEVRVMHEKCEHVKDASGRIVRAVGMVQDITERKQAEEKIKGQLEELQRWHDVMLDREDRVQEIKREVNELLAKAGQPPRYPSVLEGRDVPTGPAAVAAGILPAVSGGFQPPGPKPNEHT